SGLFLDYLNESLSPFQKAGDQAEALRAEIHKLQNQIQELRQRRKLKDTAVHQEKLGQLKSDYQKLFRQMRQPLLTLQQLDPFNMEQGSFESFLRKNKQSHYPDLLLQSAQAFDRNSNAGDCVSITP